MKCSSHCWSAPGVYSLRIGQTDLADALVEQAALRSLAEQLKRRSRYFPWHLYLVPESTNSNIQSRAMEGS